MNPRTGPPAAAVAAAAIAAFLTSAACALPQQSRERIDSDWALSRSIQGRKASPLHKLVFGAGPLDGRKYEAFFQARVRKLQGEGILFASCHGAFACSPDEGIVRISRQYAAAWVPPVIRLSFLIHEARHAEGWLHEACPSGQPLITPYQKVDLAGTNECDPTALGAYGIQFVMLRNIALYCESCDSVVRQEAHRFSEFALKLVRSPKERQRLIDDTVP